MKNVNFSIAEKSDEDWNLLKQQRMDRGFDDTELINLDTTIAKFIIPRLDAFIESVKRRGCYPAILKSPEEWIDILEKIRNSLNMYMDEEDSSETDAMNIEKIQEGCELLGKYFTYLWT